jgi:ribosomal protein S6--L-glutamate ligase
MRGTERTLTEDLRNGRATWQRTHHVSRRSLRPTCLGVLVEQRYLSHPQPAGMVAALRTRGHDVFTIDPEGIAAEAGDPDWLDDLDVVVGRGRSLALLCLLTWAESRGARTVNRRAAIAAVHNKAEMAVRLAAAGVPTPRTFLGLQGELAATVPRDSYPLILKPTFGDNCQGLQLVRSPGELAHVSWPEPLVLAQEFLPSDGNDLKLYVVGADVWAVRKPSPLSDRDGAPELVARTPALRDLARRCGELFGLELYGVDCLETDAGVVVIEINEFPNYTGVPDADDALADYVLARAEAEVVR